MLLLAKRRFPAGMTTKEEGCYRYERTTLKVDVSANAEDSYGSAVLVIARVGY